MMSNDVRAPVTLVVHDGELVDVGDLLKRLGVPCVERVGAIQSEDRESHWDLVVATPKRLLALQLGSPDARPTRIAICDQDSRTLRNSMRREGVELVVRRPVHPAALRALVLHALYRGPEKRRTPRVSVGAAVGIRLGWRQRPAVLADLSLGGCRLLADQAPERGRAFTLHLPAEVAGGSACSLRARVLSCAVAEGQPEGTVTITAQFERLSGSQTERLRIAVDAHASGPALFGGSEGGASPAGSSPPQPRTRPAKPNSGATAAPSPPADQPAATAAAGGAAVDAPDGFEERRASERRSIERRAITLGEEANRVLMGRDISLGGMCVQPNPLLAVGENVDLAIHLGQGQPPLTVRAKVHRDDGERGVVLRFHALAPGTARVLTELMQNSPLVEPPGDGSGHILSEIL